jgi:hypothetical protein
MAVANNLATRIAHRVLQWAVGLYPPEKRAWGEAILAEGESATELGEALSWMIGGLMVAFRAFFSRLIHRSAVKNEPVLIGPAQVPPPIPWKLAFVCLAISGALLFVPDLRQALSVTFSSWRSEFAPRDETATWEKLGREAEARGDAEAMAFVAMRLPDVNGDRFDEAVSLAEHAVAKDPSLTWTYYFLAQRRGDSRFHGSAHPELTQHLQEWDPRNAVPYLAEADEIARGHRNDPQWRGLPGFTFDSPFQPEDLARIRARDPQWRDLMDKAFAAPAYENYSDRRLNLEPQVMQRLGMSSPQFAMGASFYRWWSHPSGLREYAILRFAEGAEAERAGQWEKAANDYWAVAQFGQRMLLGERRDPEAGSARSLQEAAYEHLQPVLAKLGREQEAQTVAYAAQLQRAENEDTRARARAEVQRFFTFSLANGLLVHVCALVFGASVVLIALLLLTFTFNRAPGFVRLGLTYAPLLVMVGSAGLLYTYHPYAELYRSYLANPSALDRESIFNALVVTGISRYAQDYWVLRVLNPTTFWWAVIAALGAICIWLVSRSLRHRPA